MSATCKGCGKPIVWGETDDGKKVPLDPQPPVYRVRRTDGERTFVERANGKAAFPTIEGQALVSYFATCPDAAKFSYRLGDRLRLPGDHGRRVMVE